VPALRIEEAEMARASTRNLNRGDAVVVTTDRARAHYTAPTLRVDVADAPERAAVKRPTDAAPAGSIAAIEFVLGF
jgi:hypothetical protein